MISKVHGLRLWSRVAVLAFLVCGPVQGEIDPPSEENREAARIVGQTIAESHFLKKGLPEFSDRIHEAILDRLDPEQLYLTAEDRRQLESLKTQHGSNIEAGNMEAAWAIYERVLDRKQQAIEAVLPLLQRGEIPTGDTTFRQFVREDLESRMAKGASITEAAEKLSQDLTGALRWTQSLTNDQLSELYLDAAMKAMDPHSSYMSSRTFNDFLIHIKGSLEGIGVSIAPQEGYLEIREIMPGGGAAEQGFLKPGHRIVGISQDGRTFTDVEKVSSEVALQQIRGEAGTEVFLRVQTLEGRPPVIIKVPRRRVELDNARAKGSVITVSGGPQPVHYGVIDIPSFYTDPENGVSLAKDVAHILDGMRRDGRAIRGIVIDLRGNGGGSLHEVINLLGIFVGELPAVQVSDSAHRRRGEAASSPVPQMYLGPLLTLIDKRSASASEIFAGTIQDYGRGLVVGDSTTFGKGSVQTFAPLEPAELGALKLTIQGFYRPSGSSTQHRGVESHVVFPSGWDQKRVGEATLENSLKFPDIEPAAKVTNNHIDEQLLEILRQRHELRIAGDKDLKKLYELTNRFRQMAEDPNLPNPSRQAVEALARMGALGKASEHGAETHFGQDLYTFEVLRIFHDYVSALEAQGIRRVVPKAMVFPHAVGFVPPEPTGPFRTQRPERTYQPMEPVTEFQLQRPLPVWERRAKFRESRQKRETGQEFSERGAGDGSCSFWRLAP